MKRVLVLSLAIAAALAAAANGPAYTIEQYLNIRGYGSPAPLPGGALAFLNSSTGVAQVWRLDPGAADPVRVTDFADGVDALAAHPVTGELLVSADDKGDEKNQLYLMNADGSSLRKLTDNPAASYDVADWSADGRFIAFGSNERDVRYFDVYVMDIRTGETRRVWEQDGYNLPVAFAPDGSRLLCWRARGAHDGDLYLVDLAGGGEAKLLTPHEGSVDYGAATWAADGAGFWFTSNEGRDFASLAYYDLAAGTYEWVEIPPWDVEALAASRSGRWLLWSTNEDGYSVLHLRDLKAGVDTVVATGDPGVVDGARFTPAEDALVYAKQTQAAPADIYRWEWAASGDAARLTHADLAGIPAEHLRKAELVFYPSFDGTMVPAFLYKPAGVAHDRTAAAIVWIHGGPEFQARPTFDPVSQYFVDAGYAVLFPNVRGSTGYGKAYADADNVARRDDAHADVKFGWQYLTEQPWCDPFKIGIMGSSYGGYMTLMQLVSNPYLWAGGVDIRGIANFVTYMENTGPWRVELREEEYGSLTRDRDVLVRLSPVTYIHNLRSPLMVIHGARDVRVPIEEAEQIVAAARAIVGADKVMYLRYEDEGHGLSKKANRLDAWPKVVTFFADAFDARERQREQLRAKLEAEREAEEE
jgi:dipeptidyl aminopeptidase/acylaminoacyl peptidase